MANLLGVKRLFGSGLAGDFVHRAKFGKFLQQVHIGNHQGAVYQGKANQGYEHNAR